MNKELYTTIFTPNFKIELLNFTGKTNNQDLTVKGIKLLLFFIRWEIINSKKDIDKFTFLLVSIIKEWTNNKIETNYSKRLRDIILNLINIQLAESKIFNYNSIKLTRNLSYYEQKELNNLINNKIIYIRLIK